MKEPRKAMTNVKPYSVFNENRHEKVRLDLNENAWGCSPKVLLAIKNSEIKDISLYPAYQSLKKKLADHSGVKPENLTLSNGADDSIRCVFDCLVEEADEVIIPVPNYGMFDIFSRIRGANVVNVLYHDDFSFPTEKVLDSITQKTKLIIIVNPANPLGTVIDESDLIRILENASDAYVLLDETYHHFFSRSHIELINRFDNLIIVQTFSKAFGLTGLRLGMTFSDSENIIALSKVNLPFAVNNLALKAAHAALDDAEFLQSVIESTKKETSFLERELNKLGIETHSGFTNFLLMKIGKRSDEIYQKLQQRNILLRNLGKLPLLHGYLRISIGRREDNVKFLDALKMIWLES